MSTPLLRAFISSKMHELAHEREAIARALAAAGVQTFLFERDAGARPQSIQETFLEEVEAADLYVGIFGAGYGPYTIEEFEHAQTLGMESFIYERVDASVGRDPELQAFLDRIANVTTGLTIGRFNALEDLAGRVQIDVERWKTRATKPRGTPSLFHGIPSRPPLDFIGRHEEIESMVRQLRAAHDVAVEGMPAVGKTTLALVLVRHPGVRRHFRDGVLWASLGRGADVSSALMSWAQALAAADALQEGLALAERAQALKDAIGGRSLLFVIDDAWDSDAAEMLRVGGPNCAHLLTTRDRQIARQFAGVERARPLSTLPETEAFELLRKIAPEACAADARAARDLVRAVSGLPQAVRLIGGYLARPDAGLFGSVFADLGAKALGDMGDPGKRLELAERRLGARSGTKFTLRESIVLSLEDAPAAAGPAFHALGAFAAKPARFSPEAALAVSAAQSDVLAFLAARNLLEVDSDSRQLTMHPTVSDVARLGLDPAAITRHREHYLSVIRDSANAWQRIDEAHDQIRRAWEQAPDDETLFAYLGGLESYQSRRGLWRETLAWSERALRVAEAREMPPAIAHILVIAGQAHRQMGFLEQALDCFGRARSLWESISETRRQIDTLHLIGVTLARLGRPDDALGALQDARELAEAREERRQLAESWLVTGFVLRDCERTHAALSAVERALSLHRELGDRVGEADALGLLGSIYRNLDRPEPALEHARAAMAIWKQLGNPTEETETQMLAASVYRRQGRWQEALAIAEQTHEQAKTTADQRTIASSLELLGDTYLGLGQPEEALAWYRKRLALEDQCANRSGMVAALHDIALVHYRRHRYQEALDTCREALAIQEALQQQVGKARTLGLMQQAYRELGQRSEQLACFEAALAIWRMLGNRSEQAQTLRELAFAHLLEADYDRAVETYREAADLYRTLNEPQGAARTLGSLAMAYETCASNRADASNGIDLLQRAVAALREAADLEPANAQYAEKRGQAERKLGHALRFGAAVLGRQPHTVPIVVEIGSGLVDAVGEQQLKVEFRQRAQEARERILAASGVSVPEPLLIAPRRNLAPDTYVIVLYDIPRAAQTLRADEMLYPGRVDELSRVGVTARAGVDPEYGAPAAWVALADVPRAEACGKTLWSPVECIARHLSCMIRRSLSELVGHDQTLALLETALPSAAEQLREHPVELSILVVLLKNLLEEGVPIAPFQRIAETFLQLRAGGADRLHLLRIIRALPEIRSRLPGNNSAYRYLQLGAGLEQRIAASIRVFDGQPYLEIAPAETTEMLARIRAAVATGSSTPPLAVVVDNPVVRRFARKLIELEHRELWVLSRQELLAGLEANIIGQVDWQPLDETARQ